MATYFYTLTVPAGTTAGTPAEESVTLPAGVLSQVTIFFPPGPQGEVGVRLLHNRSQVFPARANQWAAWDSGAVSAKINLPLAVGDTGIVVQGKSPDANFDHEITVQFDVNTSGLPLEPVDIPDALDRVEVLLGGP